MDDNQKEKLLNKLITEDEIQSTIRRKKALFNHETINCPDKESKVLTRQQYESKGWELDREFSKSIRMKRLKEPQIIFENKIWLLFAQMDFKIMNRDNDFKVPYDKKTPPKTQQVDIFAKDDETALYIECISSRTKGLSNFTELLKGWKVKKQGVENTIKNLFPEQTLKKKFILFTENLELSHPDEQLLNSLGAVHFDEVKLQYYAEMFKQIGLAAKYQLLADLFSGTTIPEIENRVPAIQGKMGGHTYFSFSIEPERLLKMSYVLHRSKANENMMPTYQRIIKKRRLSQIREFLDDNENPGYFPNSIIVNLDTDGKKLKWDNASPQVEGSISKIGVLYLPQQYRSAFIIDGQHRLYGYSESKYRKNNSVPVVAFVNLSREEQVNLFMQINENQKAVPKTLRETLKSDLLWTSKDLREQQEALRSRVAIYLGEKNSSVFNGYMSIGEDNKVITPTAVSNGIKKSNFLGKVDRTSILELGSFFNGNLDDSLNRLYHFLNHSFQILINKLPNDFSLGRNSFLFVNKGITSSIMILSDIVDHLNEIEPSLKFEVNKPSQYMNAVQDYLAPMTEFVEKLEQPLKGALMSEKGASAPTKYWRKFQAAIKERIPEFNPPGLDDYLKKEEKALNNETYSMIREIEAFLQKDIKKKLIEKFNEEWAWKRGVPDKVQTPAEQKMLQKNRNRTKAEETDEWDNLDLIHYREIADKNWTYLSPDKKRSDFLKIHYTRPGQEKENKASQTKWIVKLNDIRKIVSHVSSDQVGDEEFNFVKEIYDWLIKGNTQKKHLVNL